MNTNMNTKTEDKTPIDVASNVENLSDARMHWENGTLKASNNELYEFLNQCLNFYLTIRSKPKACKELNDWLTANNIPCNLSTSLQTRLIRAVFGADCGKRAYTYARVITIAAAEKSPEISMIDFVTSRGGIEEIRRTKKDGKTPTITRKDNINFAIDTLEKSEALAPVFEVQASTRQQPEDATHVLFAAIMRQESNGTYSLVYETSTSSVVNTVLEQAGKDQNANAAVVSSVQKQRTAFHDTAIINAHAVEAAQVKTAA